MEASSAGEHVNSTEDDVLLQLLRQLELCKRTLVDCSTSLVEMTPLMHRHIPIAHSTPPEVALPTNGTEATPQTAVPTTLSNFLSLERELKESQEACREVELVAEDRENRIVRLEKSLSECQTRLATSEKECDSMKAKYDFQVEVSQRIARHYHVLQSSTSNFKSLYQALQSSLEQSRGMFAQYEQKIETMQALQSKIGESMAKRRETAESREKLLLSLETSNVELRSKLEASTIQITDLQAQLEAKSTSSAMLHAELQEKTKENVALLENAKGQASLIQKEHAIVIRLTEELESTKLRQSEATKEQESTLKTDASQTMEDHAFVLSSKISLLELQVQELSQRRAEMIGSHNEAMDSLAKQRNDANELILKLEAQLEQSSKEISDLRTLVATKRKPSGATERASPALTPTGKGSSSHLAIGIRPNTSNSSETISSRSPFPSNARNGLGNSPLQHAWPHNNPRAKVTSPAQLRQNAQSQQRIPIYESQYPLNDSVMDVDSAEECGGDSDLLRPCSPIVPPTRSLDLLGGDTLAEDMFGYRGGLKCCGEPATGMTISCAHCQDMFHLKCVEALRGKSVPKNKKYLCYVCEPIATSKAPRGKKASLHLN